MVKKKICPKCGSTITPYIILTKIPYLECDDCNYKWRNNNEKKTEPEKEKQVDEDDDKIDSFDFDWGFNLNEVYDQ